MKLRLVLLVPIVILAICFIVFVAWYSLALRAAEPDGAKSQSFTLKTGVGVDEVASELDSSGVIRSKTAFVTYATLTGKRNNLQAGVYEFSPSESTREIVNKMAEGQVSVNRVLLVEGVSIPKIAKLLTEKGITESDFYAALKEDYNFDFVKAIPAGVGLEGYLFPDTYEIVKPVRPKAVVQTMLDNFSKKVAEAEVTEGFAAQGMTLHQGVTLASIVELEVRKEEDRAMVAQLYLNRLKIGMPLQADPTAIYGAEIVGKNLEPAAAVAFDSIYNTYKVKGLPPGPIGNPGVSAMKAVANPKANDFLYFISGKDGTTHFAKTLPEHEDNIRKYLN